MLDVFKKLFPDFLIHSGPRKQGAGRAQAPPMILETMVLRDKHLLDVLFSIVLRTIARLVLDE